MKFVVVAMHEILTIHTFALGLKQIVHFDSFLE